MTLPLREAYRNQKWTLLKPDVVWDYLKENHKVVKLQNGNNLKICISYSSLLGKECRY